MTIYEQLLADLFAVWQTRVRLLVRGDALSERQIMQAWDNYVGALLSGPRL